LYQLLRLRLHTSAMAEADRRPRVGKLYSFGPFAYPFAILLIHLLFLLSPART
jgi:hypothetical protein